MTRTSAPIPAKGIVVRLLEQADAAELFGAVNDSRIELAQWLDWCRGPYSLTDASAWIDKSRRQTPLASSLHFGVFDKANDTRLVGCVGLSDIDTTHSTANLGYWVRSGMTGRGIARAAAASVVGHARSALGIDRIEIVVHPLNTRSASVARALGAKDEGITSARMIYRGSLVDARVFALFQA